MRDALKSWFHRRGRQVVEDSTIKVDGCLESQIVRLRTGMSEPLTELVMLHEAAHLLLEHSWRGAGLWLQQEAVAELVARECMRRLGLATEETEAASADHLHLLPRVALRREEQVVVDLICAEMRGVSVP